MIMSRKNRNGNRRNYNAKTYSRDFLTPTPIERAIQEVNKPASPQAVAVSCGLNNDYGHPHRAALQNFAAVGAEVYRTDLQGSLTFIWQNDTLTVETTADSAELAA